MEAYYRTARRAATAGPRTWCTLSKRGSRAGRGRSQQRPAPRLASPPRSSAAEGPSPSPISAAGARTGSRRRRSMLNPNWPQYAVPSPRKGGRGRAGSGTSMLHAGPQGEGEELLRQTQMPPHAHPRTVVQGGRLQWPSAPGLDSAGPGACENGMEVANPEPAAARYALDGGGTRARSPADRLYCRPRCAERGAPRPPWSAGSSGSPTPTCRGGRQGRPVPSCVRDRPRPRAPATTPPTCPRPSLHLRPYLPSRRGTARAAAPPRTAPRWRGAPSRRAPSADAPGRSGTEPTSSACGRGTGVGAHRGDVSLAADPRLRAARGKDGELLPAAEYALPSRITWQVPDRTREGRLLTVRTSKIASPVRGAAAAFRPTCRAAGRSEADARSRGRAPARTPCPPCGRWRTVSARH